MLLLIWIPTIDTHQEPTKSVGYQKSLFRSEKDDPIHLMLVKEWNTDPAGTKVSMTLREELKFQSPKGHEDKDFGSLDSLPFSCNLWCFINITRNGTDECLKW